MIFLPFYIGFKLQFRKSYTILMLLGGFLGPVEPIKSMVFKFDLTSDEALTEDNNEDP